MCLGLPRPEMKMPRVLWDGLVWLDRVIYLDQQVMMPAVCGSCLLGSRPCCEGQTGTKTHPSQSCHQAAK